MHAVGGGRASDPKPTQNALEEVGTAAASWLFISRDAFSRQPDDNTRKWCSEVGGQLETASTTGTGSGEHRSDSRSCQHTF